MKNKLFRKGLSVFMAAAMATSCAATGMTVLAAGGNLVLPQGEQALGKAQPHFPGYRVEDIKNWNAETDPYSDMLRARIPLQERNEEFQAAQANPTLTDDAQVMLMQTDYNGAPFDNAPYNNEYSQYVFNYWQYVDLFCPWHGAATAYTPSVFYNTVDFEYGTINIPNPAYTNAAHKNGVKSIACMYFDAGNRKGQTIRELLEKDDDGNYIVVNKLVEMAEYYGYDGYFLNHEEFPGDREQVESALQEVMAQLTERGMYTQYYTMGQRTVESSRGPWLQDSEGNTVCNSIFTDYAGGYQWPNVDDSIKWCNENGLNIYDVGYFGLECNRAGWDAHPGEGAFIDGTRNLKASLALFTPSDNYLRKLTFNDDNPDLPAFQQSRFQWMVADRERIFFSGAKQDPTDTEFEGTVDWSSVGAGEIGTRGVAQYISERSVIDGSTFYTNFNTGKGMQYFSNGEVSRDEEWSNINIQDVMPSWQWWMESDGTKLGVDFDYGVKEERADINSQAMDMPYTQVGAYNGGSSLVVYGDLDAENFLRLYKTDLQVKEGSKLSITYNKVSETDSSTMEIGVIFKNEPDTVVTFNVPDSGRQTDGWVTKEISIPADYAGEEIAAIGLTFRDGAEAVQDYQMNIGEIRLTDGSDHTPDAPTGLKIRAAYDTKEMTLEWDLADYNTVDKYNVYANMADGSKVCLGGVYDGVYYVKNTMDDGIVSMEVTAVGKDGSESEPAVVDFCYSENVSGIKVEEALDANGLTMQAANAGYLDVSWQNPNVDYKELRLDLKPVDTEDDTTYSMTVGNDVDSTRFYIPRGHGESYDLYITTVFEDGSESEPIAYRGRLKNVWSQPLEAKDVMAIDNHKISFNPPASVDWYKIYAYADGEKFYEGTRGIDIITGEIEIPEDANTVQIVLEDYSGNLSEPFTASVGYVTQTVGKLDETTVPDAVLREAMIQQIGSDNIADAQSFTGVLDFTNMDIHSLEGLSLASHAEEIILSGTPIDTIGAGSFGFYVQKVDLSNCKQLRIVDPVTFDGMVSLREVDITGCEALELLAIVNSSVEKLTYGDVKDFPNLVRLDLSGSRFDLTEGTPEALFVDQMESQVSEDKTVDIVSPNTVNIAPDATLLEDQSSEDQDFFDSLTDGRTNVVTNADLPLTVVLDFGTELTVSGWELTCNSLGGLSDYVISTSTDGISYEPFSTIEGNEETVVSFTADTPVKARYLKMEATDSYGFLGAAMCEWEIYGNPVVSYPSEVICDNQRPRIIPEMDTHIQTEKKNGAEIDLMQVLADAKEEAAANAKTVRGTSLDALTGADFIDPAYELAADFDGRDVNVVEVTDRDGNLSYQTSLDGSVENTYTVNYITCASDDLNGENLYTLTINVKGVTSVLEKVIAEAEQMKADGALDNTMQAVVDEFNAALEEAKTLVAKEDATQEELNASAVRLLKVMAKVDWKQGDKTILEVAVDVANSINANLDQYMEEGKQEFIDALANAKALLESGNAWQDDIDAATDALIEAMSNLRMARNKDILNDMIEKAEGTDQSGYTADSVALLNAALADAQAVAANENATQAEVDAAADSLKAAMSGLVLVDGTTGAVDGGNAATTPAGDGTAPKTGDAGIAGLAALALLSAGAVIALRKKER